MSDCQCDIDIRKRTQRQTLYWLLSINALMFAIELWSGWIAQSTALIADSIDMLADATVYGIGLYAVGKTDRHKARAALTSGYFQALIGCLVLVDISRRILLGSEPVSAIMMAVGLMALVANVACLLLIQRHKKGEIHMRASWIFSRNDVIANVGVIASGALIWWLGSRWPDIIIGTLIALVIFRGAWLIIVDSKRALEDYRP